MIHKHCYLTPIVLVNHVLKIYSINVFYLVLITGNNHIMARETFAPLQYIRIIVHLQVTSCIVLFQNIIKYVHAQNFPCTDFFKTLTVGRK